MNVFKNTTVEDQFNRMMITQQPAISNIDRLLTCSCSEIESVLNQILSSQGKSICTILYISTISRVIFDSILQNDEKRKIVSSLIAKLSTSDENIGGFLFEQVPVTFLFQLFFSIKNLGINIEPLLKGDDLRQHENALANLQILGDFTDNEFTDNLLFFYKELGEERYQQALKVVAKKAAKCDNLELCEFLVGKIKNSDNDHEVILWLVNAFLKRGETQKALKLYESASDKPKIISVISNYLLEDDQYDTVLNLLKVNDDPLIKFELLISMINYHIDQRSLKVIAVLFDQALDQQQSVADQFTKAIFSAKLVEVELKRGRIKAVKGHIEDVLEIIENELDFKSGCIVFNDLFTRLVICEKYEMADELLKDRWSGTTCEGQIQFDGNHAKDVSYTIQKIIKQIDFLSCLDKDKTKIEIERLHACALTSLMFLRDLAMQDHLLHQIAKSYAKNGYYGAAIEIQQNIEDIDYRDHLKSMIPLYSTGNCHYELGVEYANKIDNQTSRVETQIVLFPSLIKNGYHNEAKEFLRNWMQFNLLQNNT